MDPLRLGSASPSATGANQSIEALPGAETDSRCAARVAPMTISAPIGLAGDPDDRPPTDPVHVGVHGGEGDPAYLLGAGWKAVRPPRVVP